MNKLAANVGPFTLVEHLSLPQWTVNGVFYAQASWRRTARLHRHAFLSLAHWMHDLHMARRLSGNRIGASSLKMRIAGTKSLVLTAFAIVNRENSLTQTVTITTESA